MSFVRGIPLLFVILLVLLAVPQVSALEDTGNTFTNGLASFYDVVTPLWLIVGTGVAIMGLALFAVSFLR